MKTKIYLLSIFSLITVASFGQMLKIGSMFSDEMVLQQKTEAPIWGNAKAGMQINLTTSWNNKTYAVKTDKEGKWKVNVVTPSAGGPFNIIVSADRKITLNNVYIGEVWLVSGQSNMSMPLKGYFNQPVQGSNEAILNSAHKKIHFVNVPCKGSYRPLSGFEGKWKSASLENTAECSAVAWYFADMINKMLNVPVGIVNVSYGGSIVESWMTPDACKKFSDINIPNLCDTPVENEPNTPTVLYNGMMNPVVGYSMKGMLWYQGESNIFNVPRYATSVAEMVADYRKIWNMGEFPFYFVQIAPYEYKCWNFFTPQWPEISAYLREAQMKSMKLISNSAMAVLMDVGEEYGIHPSRKREVGERLALLALNKAYNFKGFEAESPEFEKLEIVENKAIVHFTKQFNGITSYGKTLQLFEISADNKMFQKADAYIDENNGTVVCTSKLVSKPVAVRYAFKNFAQAELFGTGGLPVASFRSDDW